MSAAEALPLALLAALACHFMSSLGPTRLQAFHIFSACLASGSHPTIPCIGCFCLVHRMKPHFGVIALPLLTITRALTVALGSWPWSGFLADSVAF